MTFAEFVVFFLFCRQDYLPLLLLAACTRLCNSFFPTIRWQYCSKDCHKAYTIVWQGWLPCLLISLTSQISPLILSPKLYNFLSGSAPSPTKGRSSYLYLLLIPAKKPRHHVPDPGLFLLPDQLCGTHYDNGKSAGSLISLASLENPHFLFDLSSISPRQIRPPANGAIIYTWAWYCPLFWFSTDIAFLSSFGTFLKSLL